MGKGKFWKKVAKVASPAWGIASEIKHIREKRAKEDRKKEEAAWTRVDDALGERPEYTIPDEISQYLETQTQTAEDVRGLSQQGLDLAERRADMGMPGYDIAKSNIGQSTAQAIRAIQESGGGISALGAASDIYQQELNAMQNLAMNNAQYKSQNLQGLQNQYGVAANQLATAGQIQGQGQMAMAQAQDQEFQLNQLDPYYDQLNLASTRAGYNMSQLLAQQQARAANTQAIIGNVGNLVGTIGTAAAASDIRFKENINPVGKLENGLTVYEYNYKWDTKPQIGLIAQEVEEINPEAVITDNNGYKYVNYREAVK